MKCATDPFRSLNKPMAIKRLACSNPNDKKQKAGDMCANMYEYKCKSTADRRTSPTSTI